LLRLFCSVSCSGIHLFGPHLLTFTSSTSKRSCPCPCHVEDLCPLARAVTVYTPLIFLFSSKSTGARKRTPDNKNIGRRWRARTTGQLISSRILDVATFLFHLLYLLDVCFSTINASGETFPMSEARSWLGGYLQCKRRVFFLLLSLGVRNQTAWIGGVVAWSFYSSSFAYNGWSFMSIQGWCFGWGLQGKGSVGKVLCFSPRPKNDRRFGLRPRCRPFFFFFLDYSPPVLSTTVHTKRQNQHGGPRARRDEQHVVPASWIDTHVVGPWTLDFFSLAGLKPGLDGTTAVGHRKTKEDLSAICL